MRHSNLIPVAMIVATLVCTSAMTRAADTEHTIHLKPDQQPAPAQISDLAWMTGYYRGDGLGGVCEEVWSEPIAGSMMGMFRHIKDSTAKFLELCTVTESDGTLMMNIKHFNADLTGWEEKDDVQSFPLVKLDAHAAYFSGLTYLKRDDGGLDIYASVRKRDGTMGEYEFHFERVDGPM